MKLTIAFAAMAIVLAPSVAAAESMSEPDRVDVAFEALAEGRTAEAMAKLDQSKAVENGDPAALINMGTAYARQGKIAEARKLYEAARRSKERYNLELADGSWVDSRKAAKMALANLEEGVGAQRR